MGSQRLWHLQAYALLAAQTISLQTFRHADSVLHGAAVLTCHQTLPLIFRCSPASKEMLAEGSGETAGRLSS